MIDAHYWPTPNGWKISIALEEMDLDYRIVPVNIYRGEQYEPDFLAISPNNRMPAIVDHDPQDGGEPLAVFESGAILIYLAEKTGRFLPTDLRGRKTVLEWLSWQLGGLGPMIGQAGHFKLYAPEQIPYAIERYRSEMLPPLRCARPAPRRARVHCRRLLHRRHGPLALGHHLQGAEGRPRRVPPREALVQGAAAAAGA